MDCRNANLKSLANSVFSKCYALKHVLLNDGLETIQEKCFYESGLEKITIPRTVKLIEENAFVYCENLNSVTIEGSALEIIESLAFSCTGLTTFVAPASLREIGVCAFSHCKSLKYVDLSACLLDQQDSAHPFLATLVFSDTGLANIKLPRTLRVIGKDALS